VKNEDLTLIKGAREMVTRRNFLKIGGISITTFGFLNRMFGQSGQAEASPLKNMVAEVKPLTAEDYAARLEKARKLMAEHKIDGLFLEGGVNLQYFTNVNWWRSERTFGAVLSRKGAPIWVCPAFELQRAKELIQENQEIRTWEEHESPYRLIAGIMKDLGAAGGPLAVDPSMREFIYYGLRQDAPQLGLVDGAGITEGCRGVKTEKEIAYMDLANKITKLAYREGFKQLREGMSPRDLAAAISNAHQQMGVSGGGGPQFGPNTAFPHGSQAVRNLGRGDVVLVDGGCAVEGFRSDITRTIVFGTPSEKQRKLWDVVKNAQTAALGAVRPGATCESVDQAARRVIEEAGFGPDYKYFVHRIGHGIGMEGHEYPYLVRGNKLELQPGMTFSNEPGIYIYGEFGVRIEDCMVVTEEGGRFLGGMEATAIDQPFGA
jgi:Xaa-Pro dipeptidase